MANNLRQFGIATQSFVAANNAYPSVIAGTNSDNPGSGRGPLEGGGFAMAQLDNPVLDQGVWRCPAVIFPADFLAMGDVMAQGNFMREPVLAESKAASMRH